MPDGIKCEAAKQKQYGEQCGNACLHPIAEELIVGIAENEVVECCGHIAYAYSEYRTEAYLLNSVGKEPMALVIEREACMAE